MSISLDDRVAHVRPLWLQIVPIPFLPSAQPPVASAEHRPRVVAKRNRCQPRRITCFATTHDSTPLRFTRNARRGLRQRRHASPMSDAVPAEPAELPDRLLDAA
jgi:hypothetical protein